MSANVETMFSVREVPWHGLGTIVQEAPNSREAIELAGLNWDVVSNPVYDINGNVIAGYKSNTRSSDNSVLGIVSDRYKIVQNNEAFEFTDALINEGDIKYETAGSLRNGKQIWLLAKMPSREIVGDTFDPYICFTNTHDGTGAVKVCSTPVRVVCNNTLNLALDTASRTWSTRHMGDMSSKLEEARETLGLANKYLDKLAERASILAEKKISDAELEHIIDEMFPYDAENDTERKINNMKSLKENFYVCYMMPDIAQFRNTAWGAINAMSDMVGHMKPGRNTDTYQENNWGRIMNGHPMMDMLISRVAA